MRPPTDKIPVLETQNQVVLLCIAAKEPKQLAITSLTPGKPQVVLAYLRNSRQDFVSGSNSPRYETLKPTFDFLGLGQIGGLIACTIILSSCIRTRRDGSPVSAAAREDKADYQEWFDENNDENWGFEDNYPTLLLLCDNKSTEKRIHRLTDDSMMDFEAWTTTRERFGSGKKIWLRYYDEDEEVELVELYRISTEATIAKITIQWYNHT